MQKNNRRAHFQRRMRDRFGVEVSKEDYESLCQKAHASMFTLASQGRTRIVAVRFQKKWFALVYDKVTKQVKTVLPERTFHRELEALAAKDAANRKAIATPTTDSPPPQRSVGLAETSRH